MKNLIILIATFLTLSAWGQNFSTINFVTHKVGKFNFAIYLNEKLVSTLGKGENLSYRIYSEGRINVNAIVEGKPFSGEPIDIKSGNVYYYELVVTGAGVKLHPANETDGKKYFSDNPKTIEIEEDFNNPIGKIRPDNKKAGPSQGSCFLLNKQGYVLTNLHVVDGAKSIQIKGVGGDFSTIYAADMVAIDVELDLALLKFKNQSIQFGGAPFRISNDIAAQGSPAFVLGYPMTAAMGEEIKVTEGIINAKSGFKGSVNQYQFSAPVQPGNSGSPLFNTKGELIGIINAKLKGAEGVGYALKSSYLFAFLRNVENVNLENDANISDLTSVSLPEKVNKLKTSIFIITTE